MRKLENRVAIVFGAGAIRPGWSNGRAITVTYARAGATVVAVDLNLASAEETAAIIRGEGLAGEAAAADVSVADQVKAVIDGVVARHGRIDVLHNNVALPPALGALDAVEEDYWDTVMAVNVKGMFLACKYALPVMVAQGGGAVVNTSAIASIRFLGPSITYSTSKGAVNAFTQAVAQEYAGKGIRCNAVLPGFMDTPVGLGIHAQDPERIRVRNAKLPTGKPGDAWDVAAASLFLACDDSKYVTGALLPVDGGYIGKGA